MMSQKVVFVHNDGASLKITLGIALRGEVQVIKSLKSHVSLMYRLTTNFTQTCCIHQMHVTVWNNNEFALGARAYEPAIK